MNIAKCNAQNFALASGIIEPMIDVQWTGRDSIFKKRKIRCSISLLQQQQQQLLLNNISVVQIGA